MACQKKQVALCRLASALLVNEDEVLAKDLELISLSDSVKRDPSDPLSGLVFATYDTVGDILSGLVAGLLEVAKEVALVLSKQDETNMKETPSPQPDVLWESVPLMDGNEHDAPSTNGAYTPSSSESDYAQFDAEATSPQQSEQEKPNFLQSRVLMLQRRLHSAQVKFWAALSALASKYRWSSSTRDKGFHNLPNLYGGEVREYENVTYLKSGLIVFVKVSGSCLSSKGDVTN